MNFSIDPKDLSLQDAAGMQLAEVIRKLADESGTADYEDLENLPKINGVTLKGDKSSNDLHIAVSDEQVAAAVDAWLADNVDPDTGYVLDSTLTMSNAAAPADKVGELHSAVEQERSIATNADTPLSLSWRNEGLNNDGEVVVSSFNQATDYLPLLDGTTLVFTNSSSANNVYLYAYNSSKEKVGRDVLYGAGAIQTTAVNAKYVKAMTYSETIAQESQGLTVSASYVNKYSAEFQENLVKYTTLNSSDIVTGYIQDENGIVIPASNRAVTKKFLPLIAGTRITGSAAWGVSFSLFRYDAVTKEFVEKLNTSWLYDYTITKTGLYKLLFGITNSETISAQMKFSYDPISIEPAIIPYAVNRSISPDMLSRKQSATVKTIAHRGLWQNGKGVMCGASAVKAAKRYGFDAVENDVNITSDGKMVMWHDDNLSAIGQASVVIRETTLADLKAIDIGTYYSTEFAGEKILTFDEWINLCHQVGVDARIDFKITGNDFTDALANELVTSVRRAGMLDHVSYTENFEKIRQYHENATLVFLGNPTAGNVQSLANYKADGEVWYCPFTPDLTSEMANLALDNGYELETWFADYSYYDFTTKSDVFDEICRVLSLGIGKITLDNYRVEDVVEEKILS